MSESNGYERHSFGTMTQSDMMYYMYRGLLDCYPDMKNREAAKQSREALQAFAAYHQENGKKVTSE